MKKYILIVILGIFLCFIIPIIFSRKFEVIETHSYSENIEEKKGDNQNNYKTIKLLHTATNIIQEIALEEYLYNVVSAEMPVDYHEEALKAQAVVARTYTIYTINKNKGKHGDADICDSYKCCQAWISKEERLSKWEESERENNWNKIRKAVDDTNGEVITYNGDIINALYHANSGGKTEKPNFVWEGGNYPYLQIVETIRRRCI